MEAPGSRSGRIRVAFEVEDAREATDALVEAGGVLVAAPVETPWRSLNARLEGPADLTITLFQELETPDERTERDGFGTAADRHLRQGEEVD